VYWSRGLQCPAANRELAERKRDYGPGMHLQGSV
jgi:hypothetical protein